MRIFPFKESARLKTIGMVADTSKKASSTIRGKGKTSPLLVRTFSKSCPNLEKVSKPCHLRASKLPTRKTLIYRIRSTYSQLNAVVRSNKIRSKLP